MKRRYKLYAVVAVLLVLAVLIGYRAGNQNFQLNGSKTEEAIASQDETIKRETETAVSMLNAINGKIEKGEMTSAKGQKLAADLLRELRYGKDGQGYFWADTTKGVNVVLYGNKDVEGKNRMNDKVNGVEYIKQIIAQGTNGGGFTDYFFPKKGETEAKAKRAYSVEFKPFGWVIGTGYYLEDVK